MTWSYEELDQMLRAYGASSSDRENKLLKVFLGILGVAVTIMVLLGMCVIQKSYASTGLIITLVAFGLLALYTIISAKAFHKTNGVYCPHCSKTLVSFGNVLDDLEEDGLERPESLECPRCHRVVVKDIA